MFSRILRAVCVAVALLAAGPALAHEGHDHGDQPAPPAHVLPRGEATAGPFQLVAVANGDELVLWLDRFATNRPVTDASLEIETPQGPVAAEPRPADGTWRLKAPWVASAAPLDLAVTVTAGDEVEIFALTIAGATPAGAAGPTAGTWPAWTARLAALAKPAVIATLAGGIAAGLLLAGLLGRRRAAAVPLAAVVLVAAVGLGVVQHESVAREDPGPAAPPAARPATAVAERAQRQADGTIFVPKAVQRIFALENTLSETGAVRRAVELPGRIIPDPDAAGHVQTAVGGRLSPPPGGFPRLGSAVKAGEVLAYVMPPVQAIDASDMRQRQGELDQQIAIVERRIARWEPLASAGAVTRTQLEEARLELQGLKDRRAALDRIRREPEALVAPVSGIVADGVPIAGQIAQTNATVFQIVDPARLWVEALSFDPLDGLAEATAVTATGATLPLAFRGAGFADRGQAIPVHFAITGETRGIRTGQFVTVLAATGDARTGITVPRSAVVRGSDGQSQVFDHVSAERFVPRPVRTAPLDGDRVLIVAGVEPGHRIVVQGAPLLDNVR
ncbi:efflux RND transporter periplasmic adaptor subunit [Rhodoplanes sp. TEM]|uniref:efflux RND transporter periplasmic adaptor subunit n=1 Tax=Rhodoplanes sp. TEM TaxID=3025489 RepID=UPI0023504308|nr:HlyD family efflux transporter periplasmic adaptor subunit [Rhodoplanes sp. TEM]MDC7982512.1 efflux RND transporter periplasmic adaptor subunit [Rhodoplanes sp. TEM]